MKYMGKLDLGEARLRTFEKAMLSYGILLVLYLIIIAVIPPNRTSLHHYNLTPGNFHTLLFVFSIPAMIIWFAAFFAYAKLRLYARSIEKTPEGNAYLRLSYGVQWLAWSLPVTSIITQLFNGISNAHAGFHPAAIIIANYVGVLLPLIGFTLVGTATRELLGHVKVRLSLNDTRLIGVVLAVAGVLFCYFTLRRFNLSSLSNTDNPYFLPIWVMLITVAIPYLYAWFVGIVATYEMFRFSRHVRGLLYRQALSLLAGGLISVVVSSIALQYISTINPRTGTIVIGANLAYGYLFRILGGVGFVLIAFGIARLKRFEDV